MNAAKRSGYNSEQSSYIPLPMTLQRIKLNSISMSGRHGHVSRRFQWGIPTNICGQLASCCQIVLVTMQTKFMCWQCGLVNWQLQKQRQKTLDEETRRDPQLQEVLLLLKSCTFELTIMRDQRNCAEDTINDTGNCKTRVRLSVKTWNIENIFTTYCLVWASQVKIVTDL